MQKSKRESGFVQGGIIAIILFAQLACGDSNSPEIDAAALGRYELIGWQRVGGLPSTTFISDTLQIDLVSGSVTLEQNANYADTLFYRLTRPTGVMADTQVSTGRVEIVGATATFTPSQPPNPKSKLEKRTTYTMVLSHEAGGACCWLQDGPFVYKK